MSDLLTLCYLLKISAVGHPQGIITSKVMDALQNRGLVSDEAVFFEDVPQIDITNAINQLKSRKGEIL